MTTHLQAHRSTIDKYWYGWGIYACEQLTWCYHCRMRCTLIPASDNWGPVDTVHVSVKTMLLESFNLSRGLSAIDETRHTQKINMSAKCKWLICTCKDAQLWSLFITIPDVCFPHTYRPGQLKRGQLAFLLVAFECIHKIQWFLAYVNCIQQEVVWCKF